MTDAITRREFLKLTSLGICTAVLTGCGPASRYVKRQPYADMPEYTRAGTSVYFATTCGECPAGCGLIARTMEGRAIKVEGNPDHPVSHGATCSRGQATIQGLYNPDRITAPGKQSKRGSGVFEPLEWEAAIGVVKEALQANLPEQAAFLLGMFPDHLYDLARLVWGSAGQENVLRYGTLGEFEGRSALTLASKMLFGVEQLPTFEIERADILFSFGANFVETWISPVAYAYGYGMMRQGHTGERGYLVQFEPRMSQTAANADEWYPITPGSEVLLAQGLCRLVAEIKNGSAPAAFAQVDIAEVSARSGVAESDLRRLASLFSASPRPLALPGGIPLGHTDGLTAAQAILALNTIAGNLGNAGGVYFLPSALPAGFPTSTASAQALVEKMNAGQIKALFVHGVNPVYDLPKSIGFIQAMEKVPLLISFASFPDETALQSDYVLPDRTPLESWGYQRVLAGSNRSTLSGLQPVVVPLHNTRATADVLLTAVGEIGGSLATAAPFSDEVDYLQKTTQALMAQAGFYNAPSAEEFWTLWQQHGGWWSLQPDWQAPAASIPFDQPLSSLNVPQPADSAPFSGDAAEFPFYLLPYPSPNLGDGSGANRPVLQEIPDPMTTVMWNTWVEINPQTARELGVKNDDVVKISSPTAEFEAVVYEYQGIHRNVVAIPLGQGHTAFGRYAQGRGVNPKDLLAWVDNAAGGLATMATRVKVTPTDKSRKLARYESVEASSGPSSLFGGF
jgi:anaerobic selenocysteine-containing dehydrogenase